MANHLTKAERAELRAFHDSTSPGSSSLVSRLLDQVAELEGRIKELEGAIETADGLKVKLAAWREAVDKVKEQHPSNHEYDRGARNACDCILAVQCAIIADLARKKAGLPIECEHLWIDVSTKGGPPRAYCPRCGERRP